VASVFMCLTFSSSIWAPAPAFNMISIPPQLILFWDMIVLTATDRLNIVDRLTAWPREKKSIPPPKWVKPLIYLAIPWAISHPHRDRIHLRRPSGRSFWLTAVMARGFLDRHLLPAPPS